MFSMQVNLQMLMYNNFSFLFQKKLLALFVYKSFNKVSTRNASSFSY